MRSVILNEPGPVNCLTEVEVPVPSLSDDEVLILTKAIGINPIDVKTRKGKGLYESLRATGPVVPGWDVSGIVAETGSKVTTFRKGDEVFGMVNFPGHGKTYAEYVAAPAGHLTLKPASVSHAEAAAASLAALTAWQVIKYAGVVRPGSRVLIHAAAGGVGHYAVQMAHQLGAWVAGTASAENSDFVLSLGAGMHIDYKKVNFEEVLGDIDFVLDTIGDEYTSRSFRVMKPGATIVCIPSGTSPDIEEKAAVAGLRGSHFRVHSDGNDMKEIAAMLAAGTLRSVVSRIFPFSAIRDAHLQIETGKTRAKIVVIPD